MEYMENLKQASSFDEAKSIIAKSMMLEILDHMFPQELSHAILCDFLEEMGRKASRETVRQWIVELEGEGSVVSRDIGFEGRPLIMAKLRAPLRRLPDCPSPFTEERKTHAQ